MKRPDKPKKLDDANDTFIGADAASHLLIKRPRSN
jgi:hypothetical protein